MRNEPRTAFWQGALRSLPAEVRGRYALAFQAAERWELRLDGIIKAGVRIMVKVKGFQNRRRQHRGVQHRASRAGVGIDATNA